MASVPGDGSNRKITSSTFSSYCHDVTKFHLSHLINGHEVSIRSRRNEVEVFQGDWVVITYAQSSSFKLIFRVHYINSDAISIAKLGRSDLGEEINVHAVNDFMKEFSNQCIGGLKPALELQAGYAKTSIPIIARGQDSEFFSPGPSSTFFEDKWKLCIGNNQIECSMVLEFVDANFMKKVLLPAFFDLEAVGDVEFL